MRTAGMHHSVRVTMAGARPASNACPAPSAPSSPPHTHMDSHCVCAPSFWQGMKYDTQLDINKERAKHTFRLYLPQPPYGDVVFDAHRVGEGYNFAVGGCGRGASSGGPFYPAGARCCLRRCLWRERLICRLQQQGPASPSVSGSSSGNTAARRAQQPGSSS